MIAPLLIRADGSAETGAGHVMRCLALAQSWKRRGGDVVFAHCQISPGLEQRLKSEGMECLTFPEVRGSQADAGRTATLASTLRAGWVVADGYCFDADWQKTVRDSGTRLLLLDDYGHASHYHADIVLNQNLGAEACLYERREPQTRLLLGSKYTLLRTEFRDHARCRRVATERADKVLVTLGGGDPDNVTSHVVTALLELEGVELTVLVGGSNPHAVALRSLCARAGSRTRLVVDSTEMPRLIEEADLAVTAAGSTSWELACLGLPALQIVIADNQIPIARALHRTGATVNLGPFQQVSAERIAGEVSALLGDVERRRKMSEAGSRLVDAAGADRVAAALCGRLRITFATDETSWINPHLQELKTQFETAGHEVHWTHEVDGIAEGDIAFLLSFSRLVPPEVLRRNTHTLVVHESAVPQGRGWSPLTWQILEGKNEIPVTLLEAEEGVDSGDVHAQRTLHFRGTELLGELREAQARATTDLCHAFIIDYPFACSAARAQVGEPTYYPRRRPSDSRMDPDRTLREQFNLLRVADPERYPAFFEIEGRRYEIRVSTP